METRPSMRWIAASARLPGVSGIAACSRLRPGSGSAGRAEKRVSTAVRQLIATDDGSDPTGLELASNPVAGAALEVDSLEQRGELTWNMPGQQHEHACASALRDEPLRDDISGSLRIRRQHGRRGAEPVIENGYGRLVRIQQRQALMLRIEVNLSGQLRQVLPTVYRRKHRECRNAKRAGISGVDPLEALQHTSIALRLSGPPQCVPCQCEHRHRAPAV